MKRSFFVFIIAVLVHQLLGFAVYGYLMADYMRSIFASIVRHEIIPWVFMIRSIGMIALMMWLYGNMPFAGSKIFKGFKLGVFFGFVYNWPGLWDFYGNFELKGIDVLYMFAPEFLMMIIIGMLISVLLKE